MLKFGSAKQNKTDGVEESLLGQSSKLQAENLKVLAGDVEDSIAEASSAIAGRIDEANLQRVPSLQRVFLRSLVLIWYLLPGP